MFEKQSLGEAGLQPALPYTPASLKEQADQEWNGVQSNIHFSVKNKHGRGGGGEGTGSQVGVGPCVQLSPAPNITGLKDRNVWDGS